MVKTTSMIFSIQRLEVSLLKYQSLAASGIFPSSGCGVHAEAPVHGHSGPFALSIILKPERQSRGEFPQAGWIMKGKA